MIMNCPAAPHMIPLLTQVLFRNLKRTRKCSWYFSSSTSQRRSVNELQDANLIIDGTQKNNAKKKIFWKITKNKKMSKSLLVKKQLKTAK